MNPESLLRLLVKMPFSHRRKSYFISLQSAITIRINNGIRDDFGDAKCVKLVLITSIKQLLEKLQKRHLFVRLKY